LGPRLLGHDLYWDIVSVRVLSIGTPSIGHLGHFMSIGTSIGTLGALTRAKQGRFYAQPLSNH